MKKTIKKRAFISAIAMLIVSAIVLTSSTFAWFSMAKQVEVEAMNLSITSPEGIQLSANATAWTTKLTTAELKGEAVAPYARFNAYDGNKNNIPTILSPVSSAFSLYADSTKLPVWFGGSIDDKNMLHITQISSDTAADAGYVAFDVFVKLADAQKVSFNKSTVTCEGNPEAVYAMRVAVVNCGVVSDTSAAAVKALVPTAQNTNIGGLGSRNAAIVYELDALNHTDASGIADGVADSRKPIISASSANGVGAVKAAEGSLAPNLTTATIAGNYVGKVATSEDDVYFNACAGITKIRVYMWIEGQDCDCANDVAGQDITFNFVLTIA